MRTPTQSTIEQPLAAYRKAGYGSGEIGLSAVEVLLQIYLLELYVRIGLDPIWAGAALAVAVIWDAVSDPLVGHWSDQVKAKSAAGRRFPFIVAGVPLLAVSLWLLFSPEAGVSQVALFVYLLFWYIMVNTGLTLVAVPYLSLINDLCSNERERVGLFGWRLGFSGVGLILGLAVPALFISEDLLSGRSEATGYVAIVCVLATVISVLAVWRPARESTTGENISRISLTGTFQLAWQSQAVKLLLLAFVAFALGRAVNASLALIYYKGSLRFSEGEVASLLLGLAVVVILATPFWVKASGRWGKRKLCLFGSLVLTGITAIAYPLIPERSFLVVGLVVLFGGIAAASVVLLESLFSDAIEKEHPNLSGSLYGIWRMGTKVARAGGVAISGILLDLAGYRKAVATQDDSTLRAVAWAFGPGVALFFGIGAYFIWRETQLRRREAIDG